MKYLIIILTILSSCATVNINGTTIANKSNKKGIQYIIIPLTIGIFTGYSIVTYHR